ncbi:MAG: zinc ABC transporter substrate-binding protein [Nitrospirae bacterium]|nr:zinc ABC transporter substrate-binding protein [Nitrospirota bacterium]
MIYLDKCFKKFVLYSTLFLSLAIFTGTSEAKLLVVGTTEHEALLAKQVGGDLIDVRWIVGADEDAHFVEPNKTFLPILNKADLLLVNGQDIEAGWLGFLLADGRNEKINRDQEHYINLSEDATILPYTAEELRQTKFYTVILGMGLGKTVGNHHYWLDPANEIPMIQNIKKALSSVDPGNSKTYESNAQGLMSRLEEKIKEWDAKMVPFKGKKIISYHRDWTYLAQRHGLEIVSYIEPREMTRPTQADYTGLANRIKGKEVSAILLTETQRPPYVNVDSIRDLAVKFHSKLIILPDSMSESEKRTDVVVYFDHVYEELSKALSHP